MLKKGIHLSPNTEFKKGEFYPSSCNTKGAIPWNKGKHPEYMQKENHHFWGKTFTQEHKKK